MATLTRYPSSVVTAGIWGTASNAYADDTSYATCANTTRNTDYPVELGGFDFSSIPAGSLITSVTIRAMSWNTSGTVTTKIQPFDGATGIGNQVTHTNPATEVAWDTNWTPTLAQLKSANFKVQFVSRRTSTAAGTTNLDFVYVTVNYTPPFTGTASITAPKPSISATGNWNLLVAITGTGGIAIQGSASVTRIGSPTEFRAGAGQTGSTTITVPNDAELIVVGVTGYTGQGAPFTGGSVSIDGTPCDIKVAGDYVAGYWNSAIFALDVRALRGSRTMAWSWASDPSSNETRFVYGFFKGVDLSSPPVSIYRDSDGVEGIDQFSLTMTAQSGDLAVMFSTCYYGASIAWTNATSIADYASASYGGYSVASASWAEASPTSGDTTYTADWTWGADGDGGICGLILKPAASGGSSFSLTGSAKQIFGGTGGITAPAPRITATAKLTFAATVAITQPASSLLLSGAQIFVATGGGGPPPPSISGSGNTRTLASRRGRRGILGLVHVDSGLVQAPPGVTGTVTITAPASSLAASGSNSAPAAATCRGRRGILGFVTVDSGSAESKFITGSGGITAPASSATGSGAQKFSGSGAATAPAPTLTASGSYTPIAITGSGSLTAPASGLSGFGGSGQFVSGQAAITAPASSLSATGTYAPQSISGTGAIAATSSLSAGGALRFSGALTVTAPAPSLSGSGNYASPGISGTATVSARPSSISATGGQRFSGTANVGAPASALTASGSYAPVAISGSGGITAPASSLAAQGSTGVLFSGAARVAVPAPTISAAGGQGFSGSGSIAQPAASLSALGTYTPRAITGTSSVAQPASSLSGSAQERFTATGAVSSASSPNGHGGQVFSGPGRVTSSHGLSASGDQAFTGSGSITTTGGVSATGEYCAAGIVGQVDLGTPASSLLAIGFWTNQKEAPPGRTFNAEADSREIVVEREDREMSVAAESREVVVEREDREMSVAAESRTFDVVADNREM